MALIYLLAYFAVGILGAFAFSKTAKIDIEAGEIFFWLLAGPLGLVLALIVFLDGKKLFKGGK